MNAGTPQQQFSFTFKAPIWQIRPDYGEGLLALELRDGERLQVEFIVLDINTGQVGTPYRAPENWWIGLEEISGRVLFLHGFGDRKIGSHQGITAINVDSREILWYNGQVVFYGMATGSRVIVQPDKTEENIFHALDVQTGAVVALGISPMEAQAVVSNFAQTQIVSGHYPVHYPAGSEYFTLLQQFILSRSGRQAVGAIDYLETENFLTLSYYEPVMDGKWRHLLGVYSNNEGSLLFEEVLTAAGTGLATDSFFILNKTLIVIQEKSTLVGYSF